MHHHRVIHTSNVEMFIKMTVLARVVLFRSKQVSPRDLIISRKNHDTLLRRISTWSSLFFSLPPYLPVISPKPPLGCICTINIRFTQNLNPFSQQVVVSQGDNSSKPLYWIFLGTRRHHFLKVLSGLLSDGMASKVYCQLSFPHI